MYVCACILACSYVYVNCVLIFCCDFRYEILLNCWEEDPNIRPSFSELATTITIVLEGIAGYMPLKPCTLSLSASGEGFANKEWTDDTAAAEFHAELQETDSVC